MIPSIGNFTLYLSVIFALLQIIIIKKKNDFFSKSLKKNIIFGLLLLILISFFSLMYSHIISDFSVKNVFENSHTTKPLLYKISGVWGNHEGSMLLWILVLVIFNCFIFKLFNKNNFLFVSKALQIQGVIIIGFVVFTIFTSNPFDRIFPIPENGLGFNPILQDPALAIHPPLLYLGYVGFSAAFSLSVAAMHLKNIEEISLYTYIKPFVITAWSFLTIGITFGSIWAYYELGWGGWWFWDPVENSSLMPWLLGTALMHSIIIAEKRKTLQTWVLLLAILTFLLSVIGTFLVRSGILTSVHTFALDPTRGIYILAFVALLGGYSLILFTYKSKKFITNKYFSFFSREGSILVNNVLMIIVCATVLLGTIYPLIIEAIFKNKISVGEPYFNSTTIPITIPLIVVMGIVPILSWDKTNILVILKKIYPAVILTVLFTAAFFLSYQSYNILGLIGVSLAFWIMSNIILLFIQILFSKNNESSDNKIKSSTAMLVAHFGISILILGITGSSAWQEEKITRININDKINIKNYNIFFKKIDRIKKSNYIAIQGSFWVYDENRKLVTKLKPENRFYPVTNNTTSEISIHTNILRDLYIVLGEGNLNNGWVVRVYYNPLVIWIWIGAFIIFMGGLLSLKKNLKIIKYLNS